MAKYLNKGLPPGAFRDGYEFFPVGEIAEFPKDVQASKYWVPLDEEAVEALAKIGVVAKIKDDSHVREALGGRTPPGAPYDSGPKKEDDGERTLGQMAKEPGGVVPAGTPPKRASDRKV